MSKGSNSKKQIGVDERMVIADLQKNAKVSIGKCGFSRQRISGVIERLEENKTIWGYKFSYGYSLRE